MDQPSDKNLESSPARSPQPKPAISSASEMLSPFEIEPLRRVQSEQLALLQKIFEK